ncbi:hypothetical protein SAMN04487914_11337 [Arthrobacter sp. ok909]|nr:hypothetical protein SAMN04487914_11337 [Arthrobacter sp. ok909]
MRCSVAAIHPDCAFNNVEDFLLKGKIIHGSRGFGVNFAVDRGLKSQLLLHEIDKSTGNLPIALLLQLISRYLTDIEPEQKLLEICGSSTR